MLYLCMEVAGCPTVCRHCWAQGTGYGMMPLAGIEWVLQEAHRFCPPASRSNSTASPPCTRCARSTRFPEEHSLIGWRLFRVRRSDSGFVLTAPLIHNSDFERFPSPAIDAICYQIEHPAPAPGCRCGLYAAIKGALDSLPGYLSDSAHDPDPRIYAEIACTGRVFVDSRGVRAQRIEILQLATWASLWPDPGLRAQAMAELSQRYRVEVCGLDVVPQWVVANVMPRARHLRTPP
jgi:hypothetical protein